MAPKSLILITNDDGIDAPALLPLKQALDTVAETLVFAPDHNWSASGHPKTMHKPLRADPIILPDGSPAFVSTAPPPDCVGLALLGVVERRPDLVNEAALDEDDRTLLEEIRRDVKFAGEK